MALVEELVGLRLVNFRLDELYFGIDGLHGFLKFGLEEALVEASAAFEVASAVVEGFHR